MSADEFVWLEYPAHGGRQRFAATAANLWRARGWVDSDPAPEPDLFHDPPIEADTAPEPTDAAPPSAGLFAATPKPVNDAQEPTDD